MTAAAVRGREVTSDQIGPMSAETEQNFNDLYAKYQELTKQIGTLQQTTARESKRLAELRALEKQANLDLEEAKRVRVLAQEKNAQAVVNHQTALERKKASDLRLIALARKISDALNEQGTINGMVGGLTRMIYGHYESSKPEEKGAMIAKARAFVEQNFGTQIVDSFYEEKWTFNTQADKRCVNLTKKATNDFVIAILMSKDLPKNEEVTADLGGFKDELSFDALLEIVKKAPKVALIKVDRKFSDDQLKILATTVADEKRKIPLVKFSDEAYQQKYVEFFKGRMATTSKPLPTPPAKRT